MEHNLQAPFGLISAGFFHPQSNGLVERFHHRLKVSLRAWLSGTDWFHHLPLVLLGLRSVPREDSAVSVSEALFGTTLVLPGEFRQSGASLITAPQKDSVNS